MKTSINRRPRRDVALAHALSLPLLLFFFFFFFFYVHRLFFSFSSLPFLAILHILSAEPPTMKFLKRKWQMRWEKMRRENGRGGRGTRYETEQRATKGTKEYYPPPYSRKRACRLLSMHKLLRRFDMYVKSVSLILLCSPYTHPTTLRMLRFVNVPLLGDATVS